MSAQANLNVIHVGNDSVLILGGGPVGLMTAAVLAFYGVKSVVLERNSEPTKWPKMDLTNARSMELLRKIGLSESLRQQGVPSDIPYTVLISTGLSQDTPVTQWNHPSVDQYRQTIEATNDGTQPVEPYQRISQQIFESLMRDMCQESSLIDLRYGHKLESVTETAEGVEAQITKDGEAAVQLFKSKLAVACDGASSRSRKCLGITMDGGPIPATFLLIHFKSRDLENLHKQGRFWHLFMLKDGAFGGAVIAQDEKEIFTVHFPLAPGVDESAIASEDAVYTVLGGLYQPFKIKIDEVLVRSTFQPSIAVANSFSGPNHRLFLAGDSAHMNIPTGGYGMNTGLGDAFDIGWKLAAFINGYAGEGLLKSYEQERKPIAAQNVSRSGVHMSAHLAAVELMGKNALEIDRKSDEGSRIRKSIHQHYAKNDGENTDLGIEMGCRYVSSICMPDESEHEPAWDPHTYLPTTWPGSRAPHVFLKDKSSIFDHLGDSFSLVDFSGDSRQDSGGCLIVEASNALGIPLKHVELAGEDHAAKIWEKPLVLVRPDGHVAWRGVSVADRSQAYLILKTAVGHCEA
ncbi:FAD-binding domain-containing protein [Dactylonectria macrodidyma]|uniref:FAD-binding domain-containing protein n=1 Tax=Dactylonectria macrodidyma TaxID=307937 RepID=A0A9P9FFV3_9HYPO|nr:FAD-binding domain-containing protein [Dactylonectria macrodidyma]